MNDSKDEFAGQGGSYVVGKDGKRQLVEQTAPAPSGGAGSEQPKQAPAPEPAAPADDKTASAKARKGV
jgi:hypothetical protein